MKPILKQNSLYIILALVFLLPNYSHAEEIFSPSGFSVEPAISQVSVLPNSQLKAGFTVRNTGKDKITFTVRVADFSAEGDMGGIKEAESVSDNEDPIMASGWFSVPLEPISVAPGLKMTIPYSILVPKDAGPGGRSITFIIESTSGNVHSRINALCFLSIPGDAKESLEVVDFSFNPTINSKAEGTLHIELKNTGKTHINPEGRVVIRNMFGVERGSYPLVQALSLGTIIPSAKRSSDYSWSGSLNSFDFGIWNAKIELDYGMKGSHSITARSFFAILPWQAILYTIFIFGGSIIFFIFSVRKLKKNILILKEKKLEVDESTISIKLLVIPFIAGLLLLIVIISSLFSVLGYRGGGVMNKVSHRAIN